MVVQWAHPVPFDSTAAQAIAQQEVTRVESKFVSINGARLNYGEGPANGRSLFFLGGFPSAWDNYSPFYEHLKGHYHVFSPSLRGLGFSDRANSYPIAQWIDDIDHFVQTVMEPPVLGIGHSAGAWFGLAAAGRNPGLFSAYISLDQPLNPEDHLAHHAERLPTVKGMADAIRGAKDVEDLGRRLAQVPLPEGGTLGDVLSEEELAEEAAVMIRYDPAIYDGWVKDGLASWILIPELLSWPGAYRNPLLFLDGDPAAGSMVSEKGAAYNRACYPWAERIELEGLGHGLGLWQDPGLVANEVKRFFDALPPASY